MRSMIEAVTVTGVLIVAGSTALPAQLPAPTNVVATATGPTTAHVAWTPRSAMGYQVLRYRADNPKAPEAQSIQLAAGSSQWDDSGLQAGVAYQYTVAALYATGSGQTSVSLTMPASTTTRSVLSGVTLSRSLGTSSPPPPAPPPPAPVPLPKPPAGTRVTPAAGLPGTAVRVEGTGLSLVSAVMYGSQSLKWAPVSDQQLTFSLPRVTGFGGVPILVSLLTREGVLGTITPSPIVANPPELTNIYIRDVSYTPFAVCCGRLQLIGQGLSNPAGGQPVVKVNGIPAIVASARDAMVEFQLPNPAPGFAGGLVPVTLEHLGGIATLPKPFFYELGPPVITAISPADIPIGVATTVTVTGTHLAQAKGLCLPPPPGGYPETGMFLRPDWPPVTAAANTQFQAVVQLSKATNGPVKVLVPSSTTSGLTGSTISCVANATPVYVQVH